MLPGPSLPLLRQLSVTDRLYLAILAMQTPFVLTHLINLWRNRPHYEFFPFELMAAGYLIWTRFPNTAPRRSGSLNTLCRWMLYGGLTFMAAALVFVSPWLATIGFLLTAGGLGIRILGPAARHLLAPWLLCWLVVPPPLGLDDRIIQSMQTMTSGCVSRLLEWLGVLHVMVGNTFELNGHRLFVAEACSGIHSQLVLVAVCLVMMVYQRRRVIDTFLMTAAASFWSLIANVARITVVVYAAANFDVDLSEGWAHELLGFVLILAGFALLMSTDHFWRGIKQLREPPDYEVRIEETSELARRFDQKLCRFTDWCFGSAEAYRNHVVVPGKRAGAQKAPYPLIVFTALVALVSSLQVVVLASGRGDAKLDSVVSWFPDDLMAERVGPWQLRHYDTEVRDRHSDQGQFSQVWRYESDSTAAQVSIDFPFAGWHELTRCYVSRGWKIRSQDIIGAGGWGRDRHQDGPFVQVRMIGPDGQCGLLLFSLLDRDGQALACETEYWQNRISGSPLVNAFADSASPLGESTLQIQVLAVSEIPFTDRQVEHCNQLYLDSRHRARVALTRGGIDVAQ